jgi:hypothetical protein
MQLRLLGIQLLKKEVIPAKRLQRARPTGTFYTWSPNFSRSVMKIRTTLSGTYSQNYVIYIRNVTIFVFFHIQGLRIFASTLSDFR